MHIIQYVTGYILVCVIDESDYPQASQRSIMISMHTQALCVILVLSNGI